MIRFLVALAAVAGLLGGTVSWAGQQGKQVTIRWHGQSFFEIESSQGVRIVLDPHAIEAYGRKAVSADLVLLSHLHNDHTQMEPIANRAKARIIPGLRTSGKRQDWNLFEETFRDVRIRTVGVFHDNVQGMERGKNTIFVLDVDGVRIVHLGDLGHRLSATDLKKIGPVDVLMIPVGGVYTINGSEAKEIVQQLRPRQYILPMHYGTRVYDDLLPPDEFLEGQKTVKKLPGNKLTTDASFQPPEPIIVLLDWK